MAPATAPFEASLERLAQRFRLSSCRGMTIRRGMTCRGQMSPHRVLSLDLVGCLSLDMDHVAAVPLRFQSLDHGAPAMLAP